MWVNEYCSAWSNIGCCFFDLLSYLFLAFDDITDAYSYKQLKSLNMHWNNTIHFAVSSDAKKHAIIRDKHGKEETPVFMVIFAQIILNWPFQIEHNFLLHLYKRKFDLSLTGWRPLWYLNVAGSIRPEGGGGTWQTQNDIAVRKIRKFPGWNPRFLEGTFRCWWQGGNQSYWPATIVNTKIADSWHNGNVRRQFCHGGYKWWVFTNLSFAMGDTRGEYLL